MAEKSKTTPPTSVKTPPIADSKPLPKITSNFSSLKKETPNLNNIFKKKEVEKEDTPISNIEKRNQPYDKQQLADAWNNFIAIQKVEGATLSLLKNEYLLKDNNIIEIQLKSPIETKLLSSINDELVQSLRKKLSNDFISISTNLNMAVAQKKAYTNAEIFMEMAEKNPDLLKLKEALGLDTEY